MVQKHPLCRERLRRVPAQFSWVDQRLVREGAIDRLSHPAAALYLFLVTVADSQGLSYYSDPTLGRRLSMDEELFRHTRGELIQAGLIAYRKPLYQVLSFDPAPSAPTSRPAMDRAASVGEIFRQILGGAR